MTVNAKSSRETAEERFERVQKVATKLSEGELSAVRLKTARLKALRSAKESSTREAGVAE